ncbi:bifunctional helix-turn-helix transcriptional regulator/GNAT family N-acetyltransferase [Streptomyces boninensis]|uniref:bifunctional helix-turn-helix transcriptional regulator/GNAT family N-acetyltransferase n=1 Tax=Streptomyces boninensis TaxID=2039455 RepID=UPI003B2163C7
MTIQDIRSFNRFYTNLIGALDFSRHLYTPYTLTEARLLYELAHREGATDAAELRAALNLDAGYLSRLLAKFEKEGLATRDTSAADARRRRVTLTGHGREASRLLEERSQESVGILLSHVPAADRPRLAHAMSTIEQLLSGAGANGDEPQLLLRHPAAGDLGWMIHRNAALYTQEFGWNGDYEALVARIVADYARDHDPARERVWIAELGGRPVGAVMCVQDQDDPDAARLRLLLVEPDARGHKVGSKLVDACIEFAHETGYRRIVLWTNSVLASARSIYQRAGFELVAEKPHHSFGADLVGQDWRLDL